MITGAGVLRFLDPVDPDNIWQRHPGDYSWWRLVYVKDVPPLDLFLLERTPGIRDLVFREDAPSNIIWIDIQIDAKHLHMIVEGGSNFE